MMEIHIQNGNARRPLIQESLCGNGGIIDEAIAAEHIGRCMVARRAAQGKCRLGPFRNRGLRRQGDIGAGLGCLPGAIADRGFRRQAIVPDLAIDEAWRFHAHTSRRPRGRDGFPFKACRLPFIPAARQKCQKFSIVNAPDRVQPKVIRFLHRSQIDLLHTG